jgi:hypothetical protein
MDNNGWPDPARPGVPLNPDQEGWHWVQRVDKGFVPSPRIILWTDDWTSRQFNNGWPDPARPGVPLNPDQEGWHWVQRVDKGFVPSPRIILWTDDWTSRQFSWDAIGYEADERRLGRDFRYLGPCLTPAEVDARVKQARRDALEEAARVAERSYVKVCCGFGIGSPPECCTNGIDAPDEPKFIAAAIRALKGEGDE